MIELISKRGENSKIFVLGGNKYRLEIGGAHAHYKDNYADAKEQWKECDLTIVDNKITKAPYILEIDGDKYAVTDKKTGKVSVVERLDKDTDFKLIPGTHTIRFQTTIKEEKDLKDLKYKISGDIPVVYSAYDADGDAVPLITSLSKGVLTESVDAKSFTSLGEKKTAIKYPIKIDPTLTIQGSGKDNTLEENSATNNWGSLTFIRIGTYSGFTKRGIIDMSLSALPSGCVISTATLSLYWFSHGTWDSPAGETITVYKIRRADWVEAEATWNIYKTSNNWGTAGCANTANDIDTSITGTGTVPATINNWCNIDVKSIVENAVTNSVNFNIRLSMGWTYKCGDAYSKEYATDTSLRPKLVIDYTAAATRIPKPQGGGTYQIY
mgnify:CR=1 FL=1